MAKEQEGRDEYSSPHHAHRSPSKGQLYRREVSAWQDKLAMAHKIAKRDGGDPLQILISIWGWKVDPNRVKRCDPSSVLVRSLGPSQNGDQSIQAITTAVSRVISFPGSTSKVDMLPKPL